jgi:flagellar basal-body rod protein FlgF
MESLELLANNVANASTGGYKADREFYSLYISPEAADADATATMPVIERPWTDMSQGVVQATGNQLDVSLTGKGFFAVNGPNGPLYTRNGSFRLSPDGTLVTPDGNALRSTNGKTLTLASNRPIDIGNDGTVRQDGSTLGQLELVDFGPAAGLTKQGSNYFRPADPSARTASRAVVEQGKLEGSNSGNAEAAVRLVSVMRQFEMLQKAVTIGGEMNRQAVEQVAKVGS